MASVHFSLYACSPYFIELDDTYALSQVSLAGPCTSSTAVHVTILGVACSFADYLLGHRVDYNFLFLAIQFYFMGNVYLGAY
jgi:hypothetical protein